MAPKDPVTTPAFPGAEVKSVHVHKVLLDMCIQVNSAPGKNVSNSPIIPIASEPAKDASKELVKDGFKEPEKEAPKGGVDAKKSSELKVFSSQATRRALMSGTS